MEKLCKTSEIELTKTRKQRKRLFKIDIKTKLYVAKNISQ